MGEGPMFGHSESGNAGISKLNLVSRTHTSKYGFDSCKLHEHRDSQAGLQKDFRKDYYAGLKGVYFFRILRTIIRLGALDRRDVKILDFGCGTGRLRQLLPEQVTGYDIIPELSDITDWRNENFDVVVANEVFYLFTREELMLFLARLRRANPYAELIVGISRQGFLNKVGAYLADEPDAHLGAKLNPREELDILTKDFDIVDRATVFQLSDVYYMRPGTSKAMAAHARGNLQELQGLTSGRSTMTAAR
jgi:SAM-dependent methyltransferase